MDIFNIMFEVCLKKKTSERMIKKGIGAFPDKFWMISGESARNGLFWPKEIDPIG